MNEDLGLALEIILLTEIIDGNLDLKELLPIYFSLKAYMKILDPKESIRFKPHLHKLKRLINKARHLQKGVTMPSLAKEYLDMNK